MPPHEKHISEVVKLFIQNSKLQERLYQTRIQKLWEKSMGPTVNSYTTQLRLHKRTLYIHIHSAPLRQELSYGKEKIKILLNNHLGEEYLQNVVIR